MSKKKETTRARLDRQPSQRKLEPNANTIATVELVQREIQKKLVSKGILDNNKTEEIRKAAEQVLENILWAQNITMNQSESRVTPAPPNNPRKGFHDYEDHPQHRQQSLPSLLKQKSFRRPMMELDDFSRPPNNDGPGPVTTSTLSSKMQALGPQILVVIEIALIICFALFVSYDKQATPVMKVKPSSGTSTSTTHRGFDYGFGQLTPPPDRGFGDLDHQKPTEQELHKYYYFFQDVHVMIFIGFGFLMTFLKKYGYSAVGYNLLIAAIAIQWSILCRGLFHHVNGVILIDITSFINGDFAAAAVLITFGAVLGVTNPLQLIVICLVEVFLYALNEYIGVEILKAIDVGGSMFIHTFGAYFGLALSLTLRPNKDINDMKENEGSTRTSDLFSMIGTVFLWMFWPSFNAAMAAGDDQHRAIINTIMSLTASCIVSFGVSAMVSTENKFNMVHVQNATLAGGVAVGAVADLMIRPYGALTIGCVAGLLSTVGYAYITPMLQQKISLHDTCGVNNLHGMPGIMSGIAGIIMALIASERDYGKGLYTQYAARAPEAGSDHLAELKEDLVSIEAGYNRSAPEQAGYQAMALGVTLGIALVGGAITGVILRIPFFGKVPNEHVFEDACHWDVPQEESAHQPEQMMVETVPPKHEVA